MGLGNLCSTIEWVSKPICFGIQWPEDQTFPTPRESITQKQFIDYLLDGRVCLEGIGYEQLYDPNDKERKISFQVQFFYFHAYALMDVKIWIPSLLEYAHAYFRLGCQHKLTTTERLENGGLKTHCSECDFDSISFSR